MTVLLAIVGVLGVSASGPLMAGAAAPALAIGFWRNTLATGVLVPVAVAVRRPELGGLSRRQVGVTALSGLMLAGHFATWVSSLKLTSVASATALVSLQVAWVVLIARVFGERVRSVAVLGLAIALAGVVVVSGVDVGLSARALGGDVLALAGGLFGAAYTRLGAGLRRSVSTTSYTALCYGTCSLLLLGLCVATGTSLSGYSGRTWLALLAVTVAAQLLGHSVFNHMLAVVTPTVVSLVLLLEVPGAALLAAVFLGQAPPLGVYAGLGLIVVGLAVVVSRGVPVASPPAD